MKSLPVFASVLFLAAPLASAASAPDEFVAPSARSARVYADAARRGPATLSTASSAEAVAGFLASTGRDARTTASLVETAASSSRRSGLSHLRLGQEVEGLQVYGAYAKAAFGANGRLVHVIDALAPVPSGPLAPPDVSEQAALEAVLARHYPCLGTLPEAAARHGNTVEFAAGAFFHRNPTVTRVAIPLRSGRMETGFFVETWSEKRNFLHHTLVGSDGRIRHVELRTNKDSYNVFVEDPSKGAQQVVAGPGAGNAESPAGWLGAGGQSTWSISGNNAHAYLDADDDDAPDAGGASVFDGQFLTAADLSQEPSTTGNRNVAVQNLFYLNNVVHDLLYRAGFDEAAGNFQADNFGNGGLGGDPVRAEAQDGGGTDNANFSTPADGGAPRMQMYLWSAVGTHELLVNSPGSLAGAYPASPAAFGPQLDAAGVTGNVVLAVDRRGTTSDGCERFTNASEVAGRIALVDRGTCTFVDKVLNAQSAGAIGVIVVNNADGTILMGGSSRRVSIPAIMVGQGDGAAIRAELGTGVNATPRAVSPAPPRPDGDLDADIVFHEYGHGLTWRMIGSMSGPMSGAVGEGMSDVLAVLANGDDRVGEYAFSNPVGIRTEPYDAYSRTYGDVAGEQVHFDGEVYGAIGWRLGQLYQGAGLGLDDVLGDLVGGMNFTPAGPAFEDMRDGILAQVAATAPDRECLVWQAFAEYGVGVGAASVVRGPNVVTTESFALPAACTAP